MTRYRILSLDGGGIRGVLTAALLERIETARPGFLSKIDLFAGTSTGGLLALGLASGMAPRVIKSLYTERGPAIFADSFWDEVKDLGFAVGAQYSLDPMKAELEGIFGSSTLGDLPSRILITSFDLKDEKRGIWKPKIFHNFPCGDTDGEQTIIDVALRTIAAPTFFPVYQHYIDGGVVANNPSMCALAQALDQRVKPAHRAQRLEDVVLLSLGTGANRRFLEAANADWGWASWAIQIGGGLPPELRLPLAEILLEGHADLARFQCEQILRNQFWRLNPNLPDPIGLDAIHRIQELIDIAMSIDLEPTLSWLEAEFR